MSRNMAKRSRKERDKDSEKRKKSLIQEKSTQQPQQRQAQTAPGG